MVVRTIRPDTVFIPYHWPGRRSANRLTHRTLDPRSKIPEYKVSACRIEKAPAAPGRRRASLMFGMEFYVDPSRCIGCQSCLKACEECDTHRGVSMINFDFVDRQRDHRHGGLRLLALRQSDLRAGLPGGRDQEVRGRHRRLVAEAALHRAARTACWRARSAFRSWCRNTSR